MRLPLILTAALTMAAPAVAQDSYIHVYGGLSSLSDPNFTGIVTPPGGEQSVDTDFDSGYTIGAAFGRALPGLSFGGNSVRGEIELSYSNSDVDEIFFSGNGPAAEVNVGGDLSTTRLFGNLITDFNSLGRFTPYAGLGLGVSSTDVDLVYGPGVRLDDSSEGLSAQVILGSSYALSDTMSLTGDVRFIRDFNVDIARLNPAGGLTGVVGDDVDSVNVNLGIRFGF